MYFFKFIKWFCMDYLNDIPTRVFTVFLCWAMLSVLLIVASGMLQWDIVVLVWFLLCTGVLVCFAVIIFAILFMRARYREWQAQVFDKLRGNE